MNRSARPRFVEAMQLVAQNYQHAAARQAVEAFADLDCDLRYECDDCGSEAAPCHLRAWKKYRELYPTGYSGEAFAEIEKIEHAACRVGLLKECGL